MSATINQALSRSQAGNLVRMVIGLIVATAVTLSLLWLMQYLIETADRTLNDDGAGNLVDFVRVKRDEAIERRQLKPKKPPPPDTPPPQPPQRSPECRPRRPAA